MDFRTILTLLKRWLWLLFLGAVIGGIGGFYFSSRQIPIYQTSTRFGVINSSFNYNQDFYYYWDNSLLDLITEWLTSENLIEQTSEFLGYSISAGQISVLPDEDSPFINLTVRDTDPEKAAAIANNLVTVLFDELDRLESSQYSLAEKNLEDRINQVETQMMAVQDQINEINSTNVEESLTQVQNQISDLQDQINDLEVKIAEVDPLLATDDDLLELADYQDQVDQLTPILDLYQQIYTNLVVLGQPLNTNDETNFSQLDQLETTFELYRSIYINSVASLEQLRLEKDQNKTTVIQTKQANIPNTPISSKPYESAMLYAFIGLLAAGGIAFLVEYLDDTIKTPEDVENVLNMPVIGYIEDTAYISKSNKENLENQLFVSTQPRSMVSEAMRVIRTNLEFLAIDQPLQTILVTSAIPGEGKSTIAANLALIMGQSGKKTLLVDADLRRPKIHNVFNISNRVGLSDLLRNRLSFDQVNTKFTSMDHVWIITSGSLPPNPAELLASQKMAQIIQSFRERFDFIVIDSSPMVVTDPQVIASQTDGLVFVIQPGKTRARQLSAPIGQLSRINTRILGVVMNRIPRNLNVYYQDYYYASYYTSDKNKA
jgi:capsular exopolysaccharide synthesis family protein